MSSTEFKDYYVILGVQKTAETIEIKKNFRQLALKYHPDRNQGDKAAEAKFKEISEAYDVLSDQEKRVKYDRFGQYWENSPGSKEANVGSKSSSSDPRSKVDFNSTDFSQYGNFDEFINELLGRFSSPSSSNTSSQASTESSNFHDFGRQETSIPLNDRTIQAPEFIRGTRPYEASINLSYAEAFRGTTKRINLVQETVEVKIPAGVKSGSRIRLAGKGKLNLAGTSRSDLYLNINLEPHLFFSFEGDNLVCELPIAPDEAVLGSSITIPTPDGIVSMKIPAGINSGQVLRLRGKGWLSASGDRTDQLVRIVVATPQQTSPLERDYYEKIRNLRSENPRSG
ncbi:MAG: DnaJ C-terminal domain-containing protein, partial [Waterburya sp.]